MLHTVLDACGSLTPVQKVSPCAILAGLPVLPQLTRFFLQALHSFPLPYVVVASKVAKDPFTNKSSSLVKADRAT